jgi:hypothetical protein
MSDDPLSDGIQFTVLAIADVPAIVALPFATSALAVRLYPLAGWVYRAMDKVDCIGQEVIDDIQHQFCAPDRL